MLKTGLDLRTVKRKVVEFIKSEVSESEADGVVLGISGGIDSAVTAYLCVEALGNRRVTGLIMPDMRVTPEEDISDSRILVKELCIETKTIDIAPVHNAFMKSVKANRLAEGNLRARIRMSLLYYHANLMNCLVVGTGDRSELLLGYFTKYGDGGVDLLPIADIYKTEVRKLGEALGVNRHIIMKKSSPRLWPGQLAESEIGLPYEVIDQIFKLGMEEGESHSDIAAHLNLTQQTVEDIFSKHRASEHKRRMPEICKLR